MSRRWLFLTPGARVRKLEWTVPALNDLVAAGDYIAQESLKAARRMAGRIKEAVEYLRDYPNMGRPGRFSDTKELVVSGTPFIVVSLELLLFQNLPTLNFLDFIIN